MVWARVTPRHFAWQAWHNLTSTFVSRGRRGTNSHLPSFSVAQTRIYLRFPWQAWHSWHWVARLGVFWARVTPRHFAWQARHNLTSTFVSRGRRGTNSHPPWFRMAGVALMALGGALGCGLGARDAPPFCVAGVAQPYIHLRFTWQAWHKLASTFVFRGTDSHLPSFSVAGVALRALGGALGCGLGARDAAPFCVAGVAQPYIHLRFTWQAWHKLGRRGTHGIGWRAWAWFGRA